MGWMNSDTQTGADQDFAAGGFNDIMGALDEVFTGGNDAMIEAAIEGAIDSIEGTVDQISAAASDSEFGAIPGRGRRNDIALLKKDVAALKTALKRMSAMRGQQKQAAQAKLRKAIGTLGREITVVVASYTLVNAGAASATASVNLNIKDAIPLQGFLLSARALNGTLGVYVTNLSYGGSNNVIVPWSSGTATLSGGTSTTVGGIYLSPIANQPTFLPFFVKSVNPATPFTLSWQNASAVAADSNVLTIQAVTVSQRQPLLLAQ